MKYVKLRKTQGVHSDPLLYIFGNLPSLSLKFILMPRSEAYYYMTASLGSKEHETPSSMTPVVHVWLRIIWILQMWYAFLPLFCLLITDAGRVISALGSTQNSEHFSL